MVSAVTVVAALALLAACGSAARVPNFQLKDVRQIENDSSNCPKRCPIAVTTDTDENRIPKTIKIIQCDESRIDSNRNCCRNLQDSVLVFDKAGARRYVNINVGCVFHQAGARRAASLPGN